MSIGTLEVKAVHGSNKAMVLCPLKGSNYAIESKVTKNQRDDGK
jgi:hypothetical protein